MASLGPRGASRTRRTAPRSAYRQTGRPGRADLRRGCCRPLLWVADLNSVWTLAALATRWCRGTGCRRGTARRSSRTTRPPVRCRSSLRAARCSPAGRARALKSDASPNHAWRSSTRSRWPSRGFVGSIRRRPPLRCAPRRAHAAGLRSAWAAACLARPPGSGTPAPPRRFWHRVGRRYGQTQPGHPLEGEGP